MQLGPIINYSSTSRPTEDMAVAATPSAPIKDVATVILRYGGNDVIQRVKRR